MPIVIALPAVPLLGGALAFLIRSVSLRRRLLVGTALLHLTLTGSAWLAGPVLSFGRWFGLEPLGLYFLSITSVLFTTASFYSLSYLRRESAALRQNAVSDEGILFSDAPEAVYVGCLLFFLAAMTFVCVIQHFGLLWVAVEATTLVSAPLIYFHRNRHSLEATWKYLLICSVGIALALLGNFLLAIAVRPEAGTIHVLTLEVLTRPGLVFDPAWLKAALIFFMVGYGTKVGLAPMHSWLPDAHSEAPSGVSALLSGALLNTAFLGILRSHQVSVAAGMGDFSQDLFLIFGLFSMAVAAIFLIRQADFKRLLAYSSIENMGLISLGIGVGGAGVFGGLLHGAGHSLVKAMLFFAAGNILFAYRTKSVKAVSGLFPRIPVTGVLWLGGLFAITGFPPFVTFMSEISIFKACFDGGRWLVGGSALLLLSIAFIGMLGSFLRMTEAPRGERSAAGTDGKESFLSVAPPIVLGIAALVLGVYLPKGLDHLLHQMAHCLGGF